MTDIDTMFYTVANFAAACGLSESSIRSRISRGNLSVVRLGSRILIPRGYIDKLVNQIPSELR
jgi:hypothetical protein|tara:strand:- start:50 stop:238 length:189 start_codon:yes stop_codon:yes gene_type:complete